MDDGHTHYIVSIVPLLFIFFRSLGLSENEISD